MIERVNSVIQMKVNLEVKYDAEVCSQSSRADEGQLLETAFMTAA